MPENQLLSWGWRVPFWRARGRRRRRADRRQLEETRCSGRRRGGVERAPLGGLLRDHRASVLRVIFVNLGSTVSTIFAVCASRTPSTPRASTRRPCCGSRSWRTSSHSSPSPCGDAWPTGSAASPCSSAGRWSGALMFAYLGAIASGRLPPDLPGRGPHVRASPTARSTASGRRSTASVPDQGPALGHGGRHPDRLRDRRVRADGRGGHRGAAAPPGGCRWRPTCSPSASSPPSPWRGAGEDEYDVPTRRAAPGLAPIASPRPLATQPERPTRASVT